LTPIKKRRINDAMPEETKLKTRGRPKTGSVRLALRVPPKTKRQIFAMMNDEMDTPGKVVADVFDKESK
jgi:hypothetical protein